MGNTWEIDWRPGAQDVPKRTREEVLRDVKLAIAKGRNYGRETRVQGANPYDSAMGKPQQDVWGSKRAPK